MSIDNVRVDSGGSLGDAAGETNGVIHTRHSLQGGSSPLGVDVTPEEDDTYPEGDDITLREEDEVTQGDVLRTESASVGEKIQNGVHQMTDVLIEVISRCDGIHGNETCAPQLDATQREIDKSSDRKWSTGILEEQCQGQSGSSDDNTQHDIHHFKQQYRHSLVHLDTKLNLVNASYRQSCTTKRSSLEEVFVNQIPEDGSPHSTSSDSQRHSLCDSESSQSEQVAVVKSRDSDRERFKEEYIASLGLTKRPPAPKAVPVLRTRISQFETILSGRNTAQCYNKITDSREAKDSPVISATPGCQYPSGSTQTNLNIVCNDSIPDDVQNTCSIREAGLSPSDVKISQSLIGPRQQHRPRCKPPVPPKPRLPEWVKKRLLNNSRLGAASLYGSCEQLMDAHNAASVDHPRALSQEPHQSVMRSYSCPTSSEIIPDLNSSLAQPVIRNDMPFMSENQIKLESSDVLDARPRKHSIDQTPEFNPSFRARDFRFASPVINKVYSEEEKMFIAEANRLSAYRMRSQSLGSSSDSGLETEHILKPMRPSPGKLSSSLSDIIKRFEVADQADAKSAPQRKPKLTNRNGLVTRTLQATFGESIKHRNVCSEAIALMSADVVESERDLKLNVGVLVDDLNNDAKFNEVMDQLNKGLPSVGHTVEIRADGGGGTRPVEEVISDATCNDLGYQSDAGASCSDPQVSFVDDDIFSEHKGQHRSEEKCQYSADDSKGTIEKQTIDITSQSACAFESQDPRNDPRILGSDEIELIGPALPEIANTAALKSFNDISLTDTIETTFTEHSEVFLILESPIAIKKESVHLASEKPAHATTIESPLAENKTNLELDKSDNYSIHMEAFSAQQAGAILGACFEKLASKNTSPPLHHVSFDSPISKIETQVYSNKKFEQATQWRNSSLTDTPDLLEIDGYYTNTKVEQKQLEAPLSSVLSPGVLSNQQREIILSSGSFTSAFDWQEEMIGLHENRYKSEPDGNDLIDAVRAGSIDKVSETVSFDVRKSYSDISGSVESFYSGCSDSLDSFQSADEILLENVNEGLADHHGSVRSRDTVEPDMDETTMTSADTTLASDELDLSFCCDQLSHDGAAGCRFCSSFDDGLLSPYKRHETFQLRSLASECLDCYKLKNAVTEESAPTCENPNLGVEDRDISCARWESLDTSSSVSSTIERNSSPRFDADLVEGFHEGLQFQSSLTFSSIPEKFSWNQLHSGQPNCRLLDGLDLALFTNDRVKGARDRNELSPCVREVFDMLTFNRCNNEAVTSVGGDVCKSYPSVWNLSTVDEGMKRGCEKDETIADAALADLLDAEYGVSKDDTCITFVSGLDKYLDIGGHKSVVVIGEKVKDLLDVGYEEYDNVRDDGEDSVEQVNSRHWSVFQSHEHYSFLPETHHLDTIFENEEDEAECACHLQGADAGAVCHRCQVSIRVFDEENHEISSNDVDYTLSSSSSEGDLKCGPVPGPGFHPKANVKSPNEGVDNDSSESMDMDSLDEEEIDGDSGGDMNQTISKVEVLEKNSNSLSHQNTPSSPVFPCHLESQNESPPQSSFLYACADSDVDSPPPPHRQKGARDARSPSPPGDCPMTFGREQTREHQQRHIIKEKFWKEAEDAGVSPPPSLRPPPKSKPAFHLDLASSGMAESAAEASVHDLMESPASLLHRISSACTFQQGENEAASRLQNHYKMLERSQSDVNLIRREHDLMGDVDEVHLTAAESSSGQNISECNRVYLDLSRAEAFERVSLCAVVHAD